LLERKVKELKDNLYQERNEAADWKVRHRRQTKLCNQFQGSFSQNYEVFTKGRKSKDRRASLSSAMDIHSLFSTPRRSKGKYMICVTKSDFGIYLNYKTSLNVFFLVCLILECVFSKVD